MKIATVILAVIVIAFYSWCLLAIARGTEEDHEDQDR